MKKPCIAICALLLLGLLVCSTAQSVLATTVGSAVFCPNYFYYPIDTYDEIIIASNYCYDIYWMLVAEYQDNCYEAVNCYQNDYITILQDLKEDCDNAVVFSKGHRGLPFCGYPYYNTNHISLLDQAGDDVFDLNDIYLHTTAAQNTFTFIWHCETAEKYGDPPYYQPPYHDGIGYYGMPFCWTHDAAMGKYATSGSHVYLGWIDESPQFEYWVNANYRYADVAYWFWYNVCNGHNVIMALNLLSLRIYGIPYFQATELYGLLVVWGNMYMTLPSE